MTWCQSFVKLWPLCTNVSMLVTQNWVHFVPQPQFMIYELSFIFYLFIHNIIITETVFNVLETKRDKAAEHVNYTPLGCLAFKCLQQVFHWLMTNCFCFNRPKAWNTFKLSLAGRHKYSSTQTQAIHKFMGRHEVIQAYVGVHMHAHAHWPLIFSFTHMHTYTHAHARTHITRSFQACCKFILPLWRHFVIKCKNPFTVI